MKTRLLIIPFVFALAIVWAAFRPAALSARPVVAFGYLHNSSGNLNFSYLETIFPNSFASSIGSVFNVEVKKPLHIEEYLKKKNLELKKSYEPDELPGLTGAIGADILITGSFTPMPYNQIRIELNLYNRSTNELFSFANTGTMETEIFKLVDRISAIVINFMKEDKLYKTRAIPAGSRLGIISNLEGSGLNSFYGQLMEKGYSVISLQCNDIGLVHDAAGFSVFRHIATPNGSIGAVTDWRPLKFHYGPWTGKDYYGNAAAVKELAEKFDLDHQAAKGRLLDRVNAVMGGRMDVLLIVGFTENRKECWVRAVDVKEKSLIWMQSGIRHEGLGEKPEATIGRKVAEFLGTEAPNPFKEAGLGAAKK